MKVIVGLAEDGHGEALEAVALFAGSQSPEIIPAIVVPPRWVDGTVARGGEHEFHRHIHAMAAEIIDDAKAHAAGLGITLAPARVVEHRSVPEGLIQLAKEVGAEMIVLGPASTSPIGRFIAGSVSDHLLHSSPVPVLLAPRDFPAVDGGISRISVAYIGSNRSLEALGVAARGAQRWDVPLRVVTFSPVERGGFHSRMGRLEAGAMSAEFKEQMADEQRKASVIAQRLGVTVAETAVGAGDGWSGALRGLSWLPGEVLVVGSSRLAQFARVFLGSHASKIVRNSPVPVLVVPRGSSDTPDVEEWRDWAKD